VGGTAVPGYREEPGVSPDSTTETYAAVRLEVSNWRWAGVPFYLRTGKRLTRKLTEVAVTLRPVPHLVFAQSGSLGVRPDRLILSIDPDESTSLLMVAKIPGPSMRLRPVKMELPYRATFPSPSADAYERLLFDVLRGDQTLFPGGDEVEEQWAICEPILQAWEVDPQPPPLYVAGSQGPDEAASILLDGHEWRRI
jgi:glucose-6-phosphate 1-dehydrogenase